MKRLSRWRTYDYLIFMIIICRALMGQDNHAIAKKKNAGPGENGYGKAATQLEERRSKAQAKRTD